MKFTEEQYQTIVEMFEKVNDEYNMGFLNPNIVTFFQDKLYKEFGNVLYFVEDWQTITAFANPLTREWAHDNFVEKEKEFYWKLKDNLEFGLASDGIVINIGLNKKSKLTESVIKAWGYNPEMFDREEV